MTEETAGTPRTNLEAFDAEKDTSDKWESSSCNVEVVDADFARQLEREVAALTAERDQARRVERVCYDLHDALGIAWGNDPYAEIRKLKTAEAELDAAKLALAERDEALLEANNLLKYWKQVATEAEEEISRQVG